MTNGTPTNNMPLNNGVRASADYSEGGSSIANDNPSHLSKRNAFRDLSSDHNNGHGMQIDV